MNKEIYKQHILEHYTSPRNKMQMEDPDVEEVAKNASCGDSYILYLRVRDGLVEDATFSGTGCAISTAAASLLTEKIKGLSLRDVKTITEQDMYEILGIPISIGREKCALLLFRAVERAVKEHPSK